MATRPVEFNFFLRVSCAASGARKFADVGEKATKPIKVQSVLIVSLIFDLRERARLLVPVAGRKDFVLLRCGDANGDRAS